MSQERERTHRVAAAAYIFREGKVLLLKRAHPPLTFAPPGGKLEKDEDPQEGLLREIREETGIQVKIIGVAHAWFGIVYAGRPPLICVNYLAEFAGGNVLLSDEHTEYSWAERDEIRTQAVQTVDENGYGYQPSRILAAFELFDRMRESP